MRHEIDIKNASAIQSRIETPHRSRRKRQMSLDARCRVDGVRWTMHKVGQLIGTPPVQH
ncbi:MAG TPA: hypothetical protein VIQ62_03150 [Burkholderiales bacterium]